MEASGYATMGLSLCESHLHTPAVYLERPCSSDFVFQRDLDSRVVDRPELLKVEHPGPGQQLEDPIGPRLCRASYR